jgi:hypothetical protein
MADCNVTIDGFVSLDGTLDVSAKYKQLMLDTLGEDSIYERSKLTMLALYDDLNLTSAEKAALATQNISQVVGTLSAAAMGNAIQWAKEERDGGYQLAQMKAQVENLNASYEKIKADICLAEKQKDLMCAQILATTADSVRKNGHVTLFGADGCSVEQLDNSGLLYHQTKQVEAATYQANADTYRKSGVVTIGTDTDGVVKGIAGNDYGYTQAQIEFSERQQIAFEDSKTSHAVQGSSSMIGQMLTAEIAPNAEDVQRWRDAMDKLLTPHSTTSNP